MSYHVSSRSFMSALAVVGILAAGAPVAQADETAAVGGLFRAGAAKENTPLAHPLPAIFQASIRKDWTQFAIKNLTTNETFNMPIYPHYPVAAGVQPIPVPDIDNDGKTLIVPVDLTGRGVSDLMVARAGWGGWRVYSNGQRLGHSFDGFVEGLVPKGSEAVTSQTLAMDLADLQVDDNLLTTAGDFLGDGTEQVAYFRPGWTAIVIAGAKGKVRVEADLRGIPADKDGGRQHYLFAFKNDKPGERTRIAYHRHGEPRMLVFTHDGTRFQRSETEVGSGWHLLNQYHPHPL